MLRVRLTAAVTTAALCALIGACKWEPSHPFERDSPEVHRAVAALDAGNSKAAADLLEDYLATGECKEGNIGVPPRVRERPNGAFDLGLSLFSLAETYGGRFGDEEVDAGKVQDQSLSRAQVDCALRIASAIAQDISLPLELRARARYVEGNLHFLSRSYEDAVKSFDQALLLAPGVLDGGDPIGRDAAWNRAVALTRITESTKDAGQDAAGDASGDATADGRAPSGGPDSGGSDAANPEGKDAASDGEVPPSDEAGTPPPPSRSQDDRILDQLENAPTIQQEEARKRSRTRRVHGAADR